INGHVVAAAGGEPNEDVVAALLDSDEPFGVVHYVFRRVHLCHLSGLRVDAEQVRGGASSSPDFAVHEPDREYVTGIVDNAAVVHHFTGLGVIPHDHGIGVGAEVEHSIVIDGSFVQNTLSLKVYV